LSLSRAHFPDSTRLLPRTAMSDNYHDDLDGFADPFVYEDTIAQRAMAFCQLAKVADSVSDAAVRELCLTMLRKLNANVRTPAAGELHTIAAPPPRAE